MGVHGLGVIGRISIIGTNASAGTRETANRKILGEGRDVLVANAKAMTEASRLIGHLFPNEGRYLFPTEFLARRKTKMTRKEIVAVIL